EAAVHLVAIAGGGVEAGAIFNDLAIAEQAVEGEGEEHALTAARGRAFADHAALDRPQVDAVRAAVGAAAVDDAILALGHIDAEDAGIVGDAALEDDVFAVGKLDADAGAARVHGGEGDVLALHGDELPERLGIDLIAQADLVAEGQIVDIAVFNGVVVKNSMSSPTSNMPVSTGRPALESLM